MFRNTERRVWEGHPHHDEVRALLASIRARLTRTVIVVLCVAVACATTEGEGDSETQWLKVCNTDNECGEGAARCLCGVCTIACESAEDCEVGSPGSSCVPSSNAAACMGQASPPQSLCLEGCLDATDCRDASPDRAPSALQALFEGACEDSSGKAWANGASVHMSSCTSCFCTSGLIGCNANACTPCEPGVDGGPCPEAPQNCDGFCDVGPSCTGPNGSWVITPGGGAAYYPDEPVCGCDGVTYDNGTAALAAHVSIAKPGACDAPLSCWTGEILEVEGRGYCLCERSQIAWCTGDTDAMSPAP